MNDIIKIENLKFKWPNTSHFLLDVKSFSVKKGEKVFLQGPSGSGKSTLLNLIAGVLTPEKGSVEILGKDISRLSPSQRDEFRGDHMGFIFQVFNLLPYFTALENVLLACNFSKMKQSKVLKSSSLEKEAERLLLELKLKPEILREKKVTKLSIGQQQRVATARALMGSPEIIMADEPTSALDFDTRKYFLSLLFKECEKFNTTLIFVSHDLSLGSFFDRVLSLDEINSSKENKNQDSKNFKNKKEGF